MLVVLDQEFLGMKVVGSSGSGVFRHDWCRFVDRGGDSGVVLAMMDFEVVGGTV